MAGFAVAWLRGGHPERFAAAVLLFDPLTTTGVFEQARNPWLEATEDVVLLAVFGWLALKGSRRVAVCRHRPLRL